VPRIGWGAFGWRPNRATVLMHVWIAPAPAACRGLAIACQFSFRARARQMCGDHIERRSFGTASVAAWQAEAPTKRAVGSYLFRLSESLP
jgi:hypothetical protein